MLVSSTGRYVTKRWTLVLVWCAIVWIVTTTTTTLVRSEEVASTTENSAADAMMTTATTDTVNDAATDAESENVLEQQTEGSPHADCVVSADGSMECPPMADPIEPTMEPDFVADEDDEDSYEEDGGDYDHDEHAEEEYDEDDEDGAVASELVTSGMELQDSDIEDCTDQDDLCSFWAKEGECEANPPYMLMNCPMSCNSCQIESDTVENGPTRLYGKRQQGTDKETLERIEAMHRYMTETVFVNETFTKVKSNCKNREKDCAHWASVGECENNKAYMMTNCAPACYTCHLLDYEARCPFDKTAPKAFEKEGDLNNFFERLLEYSKSHPEFKPTLFSGPAKYTNESSNSIVSIAPNAVVDGPWLMTLEEIFTEAECQHLIDMGYKGGYERSMDVGAKRFDGTFDSDVNPTRTSTNSWCSEGCLDDPLVMNMTKKIEDLTGIPSNNSEHWQMLRYEETQQYEHHDWIDYQLDRPEGVRILTVFFYLNTPEAGGGTRFPALNITVEPVRGRVVIWPSTLNHDPDQQDLRTNHAALPVEKGIKYGANAWIHQRDYKTSHNDGCT